MHFYLVLDVVFDEHHEEAVALVDQLLVERIIDRVAIDPVLDEEHGQVFDSEVAHKSLILFVLGEVHLVKQEEVLSADLADTGHLSRSRRFLLIEIASFIRPELSFWLCWFGPAFYGRRCFRRDHGCFERIYLLSIFLLVARLLADLRKEFEDLGHSVLRLPTLLIGFVQPLVSVLDEGSQLGRILLDLAQDPNAFGIFKHLDLHESLQQSSLSGEQSDEQFEDSLGQPWILVEKEIEEDADVGILVVRLEIVRSGYLFQELDVLVVSLGCGRDLRSLLLLAEQFSKETYFLFHRQQVIHSACLIFAFVARLLGAHLLLQEFHVEIGLLLAQEYLRLSVVFKLRNNQEVDANEGFALDDNVIVATAEVPFDADKVIDVVGNILVLDIVVNVVGTIEEVDHRRSNLAEIVKTSVESMPQHELDDFENLESHHVFADFENVLHSLGFIQVYFDEFFDRGK